MQGKIAEIEKKLESMQSDYEQLKEEHQAMLNKIETVRTKYRQTAKLLTVCLEQIIEENPDVISTDKDYHLDLDKIKDVHDVKYINKEDLVALILVLLK